MISRRVAIAAAVVAAIALVGAGIFALVRSRSSEQSSGSSSTTTSTSIVPPLTTVAPQTIPVPPLPPAGPTTAPPPAVTLPPGTASTTPPASTRPPAPPPTVTAAPASTTTTEPTTTEPNTSTTKPATSTTKPNKVQHKTVVFSPPGAPKRRADLVLPRNHARTIVVLAHEGSVMGGRKQMRAWADFYAKHGYPTFAIDYLVPTATTPSPVYPKPERDVKASIQYLREHAGGFDIDPDRIVVQGFSTGAALGAQAGVTPNDPFFNGPGHFPNVSDAPAAIIGFSGLYDGTQPDPTHYFGGPPDSPDPQVQERYAKANSIAQASGAAGPVLLYAAENGNPAPLQSATSFRDALQSAGKDVTLAPAPAGGAAFDQQIAQQVLDWLAARFPPS